MYLQSVFSANQSIVQNYLSTVSEKLRSANQNFEQAINAAVEQPVIIRVLDDEHFIDRLNSIRDNLEQVQRALGAFLEKQRSKSPRLFFVGDDDLLDIISVTSSKSLLNMQKHWRKMFMGIDRIIFADPA